MELRDRDYIITEDGFIFRVYGYIHPEDAYICDPEYVKPSIFKSTNPRARRGETKTSYYKFFVDEGIKLILNNYPKYTIFFWPLQKCLVGVNEKDILEVKKPDIGFLNLLEKKPDDILLKAFQNLFQLISSKSGLNEYDFGVFGSLLHGFYHPEFSDLDLIVYGRESVNSLCKTLEELYIENSCIQNEFVNIDAIVGKDWKFVNYSLDEYLWHQRRKMIYAYFESKDAKRVVKVEFEPVKDWNEIKNEYSPFVRIFHVGWIEAIVKITDDADAPFIPSIYKIEIKEILEGPEIYEIQRIFSYMEEFRMQAKKGEYVLVKGNLEKIVDGTTIYYQITLSYGPRYYEQTMKSMNIC